MSLVHNERVKLLANWLDRASTACFAVGGVGPLVAYLFQAAPSVPLWVLIALCGFWFSAAVALHGFARFTLGSLEE